MGDLLYLAPSPCLGENYLGPDLLSISCVVCAPSNENK